MKWIPEYWAGSVAQVCWLARCNSSSELQNPIRRRTALRTGRHAAFSPAQHQFHEAAGTGHYFALTATIFAS
jgi:hypothetical protein